MPYEKVVTNNLNKQHTFVNVTWKSFRKKEK